MLCPLQHQFHERIAQLVYTFPEDAVTSTGSLFWSAPKRFPHALDFDSKDPAHAHFAQAAAILRAEVYGISRPAWALDAAKVGPCQAGCLMCGYADSPFPVLSVPGSGGHVPDALYLHSAAWLAILCQILDAVLLLLSSDLLQA